MGRFGSRRTGLPAPRVDRRRLACRSRAAAQEAHDRSPGQGRLLGQRDQTRARRRPAELSGVHPKGLHRRLLPRLRAAAVRRGGRDLSAIRHPQRAHHRGRHRARGRKSVRVPAPPWHGRSAVPPACRRLSVPRLRAGRQPPRSSALSGAAAAGKRRQHVLREPPDRRRGADRRDHRRSGDANRRADRQAAPAYSAAGGHAGQ